MVDISQIDEMEIKHDPNGGGWTCESCNVMQAHIHIKLKSWHRMKHFCPRCARSKGLPTKPLFEELKESAPAQGITLSGPLTVVMKCTGPCGQYQQLPPTNMNCPTCNGNLIALLKPMNLQKSQQNNWTTFVCISCGAWQSLQGNPPWAECTACQMPHDLT